MKLDDKDRLIANSLLANSCLSYRQLAKKAGVSAATAMKRVKRMENEGFIKGYSVLLDYEKAGYDIDALISVVVSKGDLKEMERKISEIPNVIAVFDVTGEFDAILLARFKNRPGLDAFLKRLQAFPFVEKTNTIIILNTVKNENMRV
jgi:DNA-binding Lrp family transcriptional regulator